MIELSYKQVGDRTSDKTIILFHGAMMTKEGMLPLAEMLNTYNCILIDLTAHGESEGKEPNSVEAFADDVEKTIEELSRKGVVTSKKVLLGYSMGGAIVCEIIQRKKWR